jgi:hypothetical protein
LIADPRLRNMAITLESVKHSSHVDATGYDPETLVMEVKFTDGSRYRWEGIPPFIYGELRESESVGKYLRQIEKEYGVGMRIN